MKKTVLQAMVCMGICAFLAGCNKPAQEEKTENEPAAAVEAITIKEPAQPEEEEIKTEEEAEAVAENADLKSALMKEANVSDEEIISFVQDDYDGDQKEEAFAITGQVIDDYGEMRIVEGSVWFVSGDGCTNLHPSGGMGMSDAIRFMTMGDGKYVLVDDVYATSIVTYVWKVSEGKAVEMPFSALGEVLTDTPDGEGRFRIMDSSYDSMFNPETGGPIGHTWKHYYFFYVPETDEIMEYGGTDISADDVKTLCGRDIIGELILPRDTVDDVFCRGNGLVVINYEHIADGCVMYYHYIYDFINGRFVDDTGQECGEEPLEGVCKKALCEEIANYPRPPLPEN